MNKWIPTNGWIPANVWILSGQTDESNKWNRQKKLRHPLNCQTIHPRHSLLTQFGSCGCTPSHFLDRATRTFPLSSLRLVHPHTAPLHLRSSQPQRLLHNPTGCLCKLPPFSSLEDFSSCKRIDMPCVIALSLG